MTLNRPKLLNEFCLALLGVLLGGAPLSAGVYNLKIVTDASPDYSDMPSMIRSITSKWETPEEKLWAMFYWNHIARRQTTPMQLHGMALTDPIRQFNDYGYAMCSTISGMNCAIWDAMGFKTKYWDISNHTVSEVEYNGAWHMYDNSMTAIYTLCDGNTIAAVSDIGATMACGASAGRSEPGHIAKYHCLQATSPRGFLTGADTIRSLDEEYHCFNPNGLKYRSYFYDWDRGHRYILNLREGESYTRHYHSLGSSAEYYVPNHGKDPEAVNKRYRIRGNGVRTFQPSLREFQTSAHFFANVAKDGNGSVVPAAMQTPGEVIFKIEGANVITSMDLRGEIFRRTQNDSASISISTVNGLEWKEIWKSEQVGGRKFDLKLIEEVNGAYEVFVKVTLAASAQPGDAALRNIRFETITMLNSKTQPKLNLGRNTIYAGAGEQTESIVFWPDLQGDAYKPYVVEEQNIGTDKEHPGYMGVMYAEKANAPAYVVFKIDAPRDITSIHYGGRLYNRAPGSHIDLLHSFDKGRTWTRSYSLTNTAQPWDVIHYETASDLPSGTRSVLFKYALESSEAGRAACSLYAVRMQVNHRPAGGTSSGSPFLSGGTSSASPLAVTFNWSERQEDYSLVKRSHTALVPKLPHRYTIDVGGVDHPVVDSLEVTTERKPSHVGSYHAAADGVELNAAKFTPRWVTYGKNLAVGSPYSVSVPSNTQWGAGDPEGTKLTDGIVGPPYPGGTAPASALCWNKGDDPEITVDLGATRQCGAFRIHVGAGWPWWDALKGEFKDKVEVLTSIDGRSYTSHGIFDFNLRWKDLPVNHFWPDEEEIAAHNFELIPAKPVEARYVRYKIQPERSVIVSEVEVLDFIRYEAFDLRLALPDEDIAGAGSR